MATDFSKDPEYIKLYMIYLGARHSYESCLASDNYVDGIPLPIIEDDFNKAAHALAEYVVGATEVKS